MANATGKSVDKTYLSVDNAEERGFIHRDYIAHCLRWSHVVKKLYERGNYKDAVILDVGCGRELPLAKLLYSSKLMPKHYFGVDVGPIEDTACNLIGHTGKFPYTVWENQDILTLTKEELGMEPTMVTCFEMLEHVEPLHMIRILTHLQKLAPNATFYFSTPCWNVVDCAANHVNEMKYQALGAVFERLGFNVKHVYGTFASIRDYQQQLDDSEYGNLTPVFNALREYYDTNFLSCIFAPLFPAHSRNALWELTINPHVLKVARQFPKLEDLVKPWGSSAKWEDMAWTPET